MNLKKIAENIRKISSNTIYEDSEWLILQMTGEEDCHYFRNTRMDLVTPKSMNMYLEAGSIYFIKNKINNEVYGYHPKLEIFQNKFDTPVNIEKFLSEIENDNFVRTFKQLKKQRIAQVHAPEKTPVHKPLPTKPRIRPTPKEDDPFKAPRPSVQPKPKNTHIGEVK